MTEITEIAVKCSNGTYYCVIIPSTSQLSHTILYYVYEHIIVVGRTLSNLFFLWNISIYIIAKYISDYICGPNLTSASIYVSFDLW